MIFDMYNHSSPHTLLPISSLFSVSVLKLSVCLFSFLQALDSVYFTGFTETDKTFVITRLARRLNGLCEMWLFLHVDGIGEFEVSGG